MSIKEEMQTVDSPREAMSFSQQVEVPECTLEDKDCLLGRDPSYCLPGHHYGEHFSAQSSYSSCL